MMTAHGSTQIVREAFKLGVEDFLEKPFEVDELLALARRAVKSQRLQTERQYLISERDAEFNHYGIVGRSRAMQDVIAARRAGRADQEHRAHHRRDRHGQGDGGAADPPSQRAARDAAHQGQLRGDPGDAARIGALRPRPRRLHRRDDDQARKVRAGRRRLDLPRRDRHAEPGDPVEAAASAAGARVRAARRRTDAARGRARDRRDQPRSQADGQRRASSRRICTTA